MLLQHCVITLTVYWKGTEEHMDISITVHYKTDTAVDFIVDNLSSNDLRLAIRDIISSSITAVNSGDLSGLHNSLQMAFSKAEISTILRHVIKGSPEYSVDTAEVRHMSAYIDQRERAIRTILEFNQIKNQLGIRYAGLYVAFYNGDVVDSDVSRSELARRFYERYGNVPVCISKVSEDQEVIQVATPFFKTK